MPRDFTLDAASNLDRIDARDIDARKDELESERDDLDSDVEDAQDALDEFDPEQGGGDMAELQQNLHHAQEKRAAWDESGDAKEFAALKEIMETIESYSDRSASLIAESDFTNYAREYAEDVREMRDAEWPFTHIDWDSAASDLKSDFEEVEIDGKTFLFR